MAIQHYYQGIMMPISEERWHRVYRYSRKQARELAASPRCEPRVFVVARSETEEISRSDLRHWPVHSPDGFHWGYGGSGPHELALSMLLHAAGGTPGRGVGKRIRTSGLVGLLVRERIALLPNAEHSSWEIARAEISAWLGAHGITAPLPNLEFRSAWSPLAG